MTLPTSRVSFFCVGALRLTGRFGFVPGKAKEYPGVVLSCISLELTTASDAILPHSLMSIAICFVEDLNV